MMSNSLYYTLEEYSWEWHFFQGLTLGYPVCCILFFCSAWNDYGEQEGSMYKRLTEGDLHSLKWPISNDYIQCPDCIIKEVNSN